MTYDPPPPGWDPQNPQQPVDLNKPQDGQQQHYGQPQEYGQPQDFAPQGYGQPQAYGQPYAYNPGYPQSGPGYYPQGYYGAPAPDHPQAVVVLILGIMSLVFCQLLGPVAWIMGGKARREIQDSGGAIGGSGMVTAGWICGIVSSALLILAVLFIVLMIVVGAASSTS
ncbi:DUF4190 domain-containing protein [Nocardia sp. CDC160]|uniref:DUF4190 domain-containing protein n=1 Tax=Nocardia sp. CDC160 TaxID=3112166 RepID=UPI002DB5AE03|nr:hypothetical protein [Nocardia sp. CDC160]MEC3920484.1 hypothetical protein [Nocardia sp. CDC160]